MTRAEGGVLVSGDSIGRYFCLHRRDHLASGSYTLGVMIGPVEQEFAAAAQIASGFFHHRLIALVGRAAGRNGSRSSRAAPHRLVE